jgi:hypothetical protein
MISKEIMTQRRNWIQAAYAAKTKHSMDPTTTMSLSEKDYQMKAVRHPFPMLYVAVRLCASL